MTALLPWQAVGAISQGAGSLGAGTPREECPRATSNSAERRGRNLRATPRVACSRSPKRSKLSSPAPSRELFALGLLAAM